MKLSCISRRAFIAATMVALPATLVADAALVEPTLLRVRHVRIGTGLPSHRLVHFSDIHHKGDSAYLKTVVDTVNSLAPDFVCFTGDIVEERKFLDESLEMMSRVQAPMFGVPGNHDYWSKISFKPVHKCFESTGGAWLLDEQRKIADGKINLIGITCSHANQAKQPVDQSAINILLMHYPAWMKNLNGQRFNLMLAGHSHGGQVRIPFYGPLVVPFAVGKYDWGLFQTFAGPLYVNAGIGYIYGYDFRFNCRPEITVIEI